MIRSLFPVIVTPTPTKARDFYVEHLGFHVVFEADWYVQLHLARSGEAPPMELAFMAPDQASQPAALHAPFTGPGMILTFDVDDVDGLHDRLRSAGVLNDVVVELRDEPWGQRHFLFRDPVGLLVDVAALIPPTDAYSEAYTST